MYHKDILIVRAGHERNDPVMPFSLEFHNLYIFLAYTDRVHADGSI